MFVCFFTLAPALYSFSAPLPLAHQIQSRPNVKFSVNLVQAQGSSVFYFFLEVGLESPCLPGPPPAIVPSQTSFWLLIPTIVVSGSGPRPANFPLSTVFPCFLQFSLDGSTWLLPSFCPVCPSRRHHFCAPSFGPSFSKQKPFHMLMNY